MKRYLRAAGDPRAFGFVVAFVVGTTMNGWGAVLGCLAFLWLGLRATMLYDEMHVARRADYAAEIEEWRRLAMAAMREAAETRTTRAGAERDASPRTGASS